MKILLMNYMETTAPGGINKTIRELAINLSKRSHEVIVLQSNPLNLPKEELNDGFKIIRVKSRFESNLYGLNPELYLYLKNHLMSMNPDLIHIHGYHRLFCIGVMYTLKKLDLGIPIVFFPIWMFIVVHSLVSIFGIFMIISENLFLRIVII